MSLSKQFYFEKYDHCPEIQTVFATLVSNAPKNGKVGDIAILRDFPMKVNKCKLFDTPFGCPLGAHCKDRHPNDFIFAISTTKSTENSDLENIKNQDPFNCIFGNTFGVPMNCVYIYDNTNDILKEKSFIKPTYVTQHNIKPDNNNTISYKVCLLNVPEWRNLCELYSTTNNISRESVTRVLRSAVKYIITHVSSSNNTLSYKNHLTIQQNHSRNNSRLYNKNKVTKNESNDCDKSSSSFIKNNRNKLNGNIKRAFSLPVKIDSLDEDDLENDYAEFMSNYVPSTPSLSKLSSNPSFNSLESIEDINFLNSPFGSQQTSVSPSFYNESRSNTPIFDYTYDELPKFSNRANKSPHFFKKSSETITNLQEDKLFCSIDSNIRYSEEDINTSLYQEVSTKTHIDDFDHFHNEINNQFEYTYIQNTNLNNYAQDVFKYFQKKDDESNSQSSTY